MYDKIVRERMAEEAGFEPTSGFLDRYGLAIRCNTVMRLLRLIFYHFWPT